MLRLIVSDLDGTLLMDHEHIHPDNVLALREAMGKGIRFAVASGRSAASCSLLLRQHGLEDAAIIAVNGCHMMDRPFGCTLSQAFLKPGAAREVVDILRAHGLEGCIYAENAIVYTSLRLRVNEEGTHENKEHDALMRSAGIDILAGPEATEAALAGRCMKVYCVMDEGQDAAFAAAREACGRICGVTLTSSWPTNFEAMPEGVDKGTAVQALAERLSIAQPDIAAFGDNDNDLAMLRWVGQPYAMANAQPGVLAEGYHVAGHCARGGVAEVIRRLI